MNTNPDELTLALWLDDELSGSDLSAVEAWAADHPEQIQLRDEVRQWRSMVSAALPASEEPPYPDFFNSRVLQGIRQQTPSEVLEKKKPFFWKTWLMPAAACAGMALTFLVGRQSHSLSQSPLAAVAPSMISAPEVYTPESGVDAESFASADASATVIVLNGVTAIPDATDFSATVYVPMSREIDSTASREVQSKVSP
jgi:hypothetical protein